MHTHMVYPKWRAELGQKWLLFLLVILFLCLIQNVEGGKVACGERLDEVLKSICLNGYNSKYLGGPIRYRRQSDPYMPKYIYSKQFFVQPTKQKFLKQKPTSKQKMKNSQTDSQTRGKRVRRQDDMDPAERIKKGIVDDCCNKGCPYSTIEIYCRELDKLNAEKVARLGLF